MGENMKKQNSKIDIVIPWVDGSDPAWLEEKRKFDNSIETISGDSSNSSQRFRDWGLMRYWFRGIEKYMPWVNKIFFVTWGHIPEWLDTNNEKLVIVKHVDYMPVKYLPTYNSNTILLNFHRIKGLSENFIVFNDDFFAIAPTKEEMFFKNDMPCDMLLSEIMYNYDIKGVFWHVIFNDLGIINKYFGNKRKELKTFSKWVNPAYGFKNMFTNLNKFIFNRVPGFKDQHLAVPYKKSVFEKVWELEYEVLDNACMNKFRSPMDYNEWLMRYWTFLTGEFVPANTWKFGQYMKFNDAETADNVCDAIRRQEKPILVINDTLQGSDEELFMTYKKKISEAFEAILPDKCSFEK